MLFVLESELPIEESELSTPVESEPTLLFVLERPLLVVVDSELMLASKEPEREAMEFGKTGFVW